jgi:hypothetical protein
LLCFAQIKRPEPRNSERGDKYPVPDPRNRSREKGCSGAGDARRGQALATPSCRLHEKRGTPTKATTVPRSFCFPLPPPCLAFWRVGLHCFALPTPSSIPRAHHTYLLHSLFGWLVADSWCWFVLREEYCCLVAGGWFVVREKYC